MRTCKQEGPVETNPDTFETAYLHNWEKPRINKRIHWFYVDIGPIRVENREF